MKSSPIPIRTVQDRKFHKSLSPHNSGTITYEMVTTNLNESNAKAFIEGQGTCESYDEKFRLNLSILESLFKNDGDTYGLENSLVNSLSYVTNLQESERLINASSLNESIINQLHNEINICESCDRVIRNNQKLSKRFNFNKVIADNKYQTTRHTVHELCALIDTYDMPNKVKLNVAIENINYALNSYGNITPVEEVTDYIMEYFLNREFVITDRDSYGYLNVLENNIFVDESKCNSYKMIKEQYDKGLFGNRWTNSAASLSCQCESGNSAVHTARVMNITNEKDASNYIQSTFDMIKDKAVSNKDADILMKSIMTIPLMGNVSKTFVDYQVSKNIPNQDVKDRLDQLENKEKLLKTFKDDDNLVTAAEMVSMSAHLSNDILDEFYKTKDLSSALFEGSYAEDQLKKELEAFKASQDKSPSKFKALVKKICTKSPEDIIEGVPSIFTIVRGLIYIAIAASNPIGPILATVTMLVTEIISMKINMRNSKSLMRHLQEEKKKVEKKRDKAKTDKEKKNLDEYIKCLDNCIKKCAEYITNIDEDDDEANAAQYGGDDDFDLGDDDFNFDFEESVIVVDQLLKIMNEMCDSGLPEIPSDIENTALLKTAELFDNCPDFISQQFYNYVKNKKINYKNDPATVTVCTSILDNKGKNKIDTDPITEAFVQYEAYKEVCSVINEGFDLNTLKLALINMKKKAKDLSGKEKEISRNIDIATSNLMRGMQQALTSNRREAIIKGSIIPSFSKLMKSAMVIGGASFVSPVGAAITAVGMLAASKYLNHRERLLIYDEIDTELQVVEKQLQMAENDGDMNQYRFLLNYQKKLQREKYRIKYGVKMQGRNIPELKGGRD